MKAEMLPEFARPFKTKGHDVRKIANEYYLYRVEHFRVSDRKYPVTKYVYIGRIDKEKGLIPAHMQKDGEVIACLEYGLSDYIYSNYRRALQRTLFNTSGEMASDTIKIGIIRFVFGTVTLATLRASRLTHYDADRLFAMYASVNVNVNLYIFTGVKMYIICSCFLSHQLMGQEWSAVQHTLWS